MSLTDVTAWQRSKEHRQQPLHRLTIFYGLQFLLHVYRQRLVLVYLTSTTNCTFLLRQSHSVCKKVILSPTSRSSAAHNKIKKIPRALCHHRSWSDKLSSEQRLVCVKVTLPVLILQVCQVLSQPPNPNWETVWDTQPHSTSPQYNSPVNSLP